VEWQFLWTPNPFLEEKRLLTGYVIFRSGCGLSPKERYRECLASLHVRAQPDDSMLLIIASKASIT